MNTGPAYFRFFNTMEQTVCENSFKAVQLQAKINVLKSTSRNTGAFWVTNMQAVFSSVALKTVQISA
jgi:hypothetical protein